MYQKPTKKSLGQHFLTSEAMLCKIAEAVGSDQNAMLFEIGPGSGQLSRELVGKFGSYKALELDVDCVRYLHSQACFTSMTVVQGDVQTFDLNRLLENNRACVWVGNLPYNISSAILLRTIDYKDKLTKAVYMLQKEVAERLCAEPGQGQYGRLGVMVQAYFEVRLLFEVPADAFTPPPKVCSAVVELIPRTKKIFESLSPRFGKVVAVSFSKRRKMLRSLFKDQLEEHDWEALGIAATARAEQLTVCEFNRIAQHIDLHNTE